MSIFDQDEECPPSSAEVRERIERLTEAFHRDHPSKAAAGRIIKSLFDEAVHPHGTAGPLRGRQRERAGHELFVRWTMLEEFGDIFESKHKIEEHFYDTLAKLVLSVYALGQHSAPDGRAGRDARTELADHKFTELVMVLQTYLRMHTEYELKRAGRAAGFPVSTKFADRIRGDIIDAMGRPKDSKEPSVNQIVTALRAVRKQSLSR